MRAELRNTIQIEPLPIPVSTAPAETEATFYGTRLSTVVLVRRDGAVSFHERDVWMLDERHQVRRGEAKDDRVFRFQLEVPEGEAQ